MSDEHQPATLVGDGLRKRAAQLPTEDAKETVESLNASEEEAPQAGKEKKTYGRTPDGSVFVVPYTHDMVSQLLSPTEPKNLSDIAVLAVLGSLFILLYVLPPAYRIPVFAVIFLFWRACYNVGIGILLRVQSNHRMLVSWAKKSHIFENPATGKNPRPWLYALLKREMETKIPKDYRFEEAPIEYNTWLLFRRVVDLILMCDFVSYCLFAVACSQRPEGEILPVAVLRWIFGLGLVGFNLWVKLDAHRVVKDYAWYWGDFFYLIDQELTFDGVFEMAPHPMYTVGYAGFYGISLMAGSYKVLFISIIAHAAQLAFLVFIENPHIDKTYNPPPRRQAADSTSDLLPIGSTDSSEELSMEDPTALSLATADQPSPVHKLLGLNNFDFCRVIDVAVLLLQCYTFFLTVLTPSTLPYQVMFFVNALVWRLWYSIGIGYILSIQSQRKGWTRHFLKYAESTEEAWRQWKGIYHISMTMCYGSFIAFAYKVYSLPDDWDTGLVLLKHVLGASLIALQVWTAFSIHESLGEFGWFFGDFFFDRASKLTYSGIYRYLNNPERVIGLAGVWGAVLITWNSAIFFLALISHASALWFMNFVEKPHMQKVYGQELREESGLVRSIKRSLPPLKKWSRNVDKVFMETTDFVEDFITSARPKFAAGVRSLAKDTGALFSQYPARLTVTRIAPDLAGYDPKDYSIEVEGTPISSSALAERITGKEGEQAQRPPERRSNFRTLTFQYGAPIRVKWTAPLNHSKKDWVGLYMVADNASREVTKVSSLGRWVATNPHEYDSTTPDKGIVTSDVRVKRAPGSDDGESKDYLSGEMVFEGDKLFWTQGVFELRYHHDGKHSVMAISLPFEIRIGRFDEDDVEVDDNGSVKGAVEKALLPVVQHCFDRDPDIAPRTVDEAYGALIEREGKFAKRVVYAVHQMFGIEFAPEVVQADGTVKNLAWRICNAKKVLAPYSMSPSRGTTTPVSAKY